VIASRVPGTRLSFVVVKLEGTLMRDVVTYSKTDGLVQKQKAVPAGYLVYFPRGHVLRIKDMKHLAHYGLDKKPHIINMQGLHDPNSPIGKMISAQDDAARAGAYQELEQAVMHLAIAKSGPTIMPEQIKRQRFVESNDFAKPGKAA
jgi:hypothetical protein